MPEASPEFGIELVPDIGQRHDVWSKLLVGAGVIALARAGGAINPDLSIRDYLPEPFDVPDHIGNLGGLSLVLLPFMRGYMRGGHERATTREIFDRETKRTAIMMGGLVVAANVVGEVVGYGPTSTPDPLDFVYGLAGGYLLYRNLKPEFMPESEVDTIIDLAIDCRNEGYEFDEEDRQYVGMYVGFKKRINELRDKFTAARNKPTPAVATPTTAPVQNRSAVRASASRKGSKKPTNKSIHQGRYTPPKNKR